MTPVLRVTRARFVRGGVELAAAFDVLLCAGERATVVQATPEGASIAARICAAIVKPTFGTVAVCDYDARVQPALAKRHVGFVDAAGAANAARFARDVAFRADAWNVAQSLARARAADVLRALEGVDPSYARGVALALVADPELLVLDAPPHGVMDRVAALRPHAALVATATPAPASERAAALAERAEAGVA